MNYNETFLYIASKYIIEICVTTIMEWNDIDNYFPMTQNLFVKKLFLRTLI